MLYATFTRIRQEGAVRLRDWLGGLSSRREELRESYRQQGTRYELFYLIEGSDGPVLVTMTEFEDLEQARASFLASQLPIDREFKALMQEISRGHPPVELLYDSSVRPGLAAS
jgi:hypothetical protein